MADLCMDFISSAFQSIWFEIAVFTGTLLFAFVAQQVNARQKASKKKAGLPSSLTPPSSKNDVRAGSSRRYVAPRGLDSRHRTGELAQAAWQSPTHQGSHSRPVWNQNKNPMQVVEAVCEAACRGSAARSMASALELYEQMKASGEDMRLTDHVKNSKYSAMDFYNSLVQCAIRTGKVQIIADLVANMRKTDVPRTCAFYESAMKILAGKKMYKEALAMYDELLKDGLEPSPVTCSCLINFAVEIGNLDQAVSFFEKLSAVDRPSIRAYMTILRVFSKQGDWARSIEIMKDMQNRGQEPDCLILNIVLATCVAGDQLDRAEKLLKETRSLNQKTVDVVSYNTLIKGYAQKGELGKALASLEEMTGHGVEPNNITFNTIMDSAVRCRQPAEAWRVLKVMREAGHMPDKYSCSILVKGLHDGATNEQIQGTLALLRNMGATDKPEDVKLLEVLFQSLLEACAKLKDPKLMQVVFGQMKLQKVAPNSAGYSALIKSLSSEQELPLCIRLWDEMLASGTVPHQSVFEAAVGACINCGELNRGFQLLADVKRVVSGDCIVFVATLLRVLCKAQHSEAAFRVYEEEKACGQLAEGRVLDISTYTVLIRNACESKTLELGSMLMQDMCKAGLKPDEAVLNTILVACFKDARSDLGHKIFTDLTAAGTRPNQATFTTMVKLYGRCQQLQSAFDLVNNMETKFGIAPSMMTYSCLLQACARSRQVEKVLEVFSVMKEQVGKVPDGPTYSAVISSCAASASHQGQAVLIADEALRERVELPDDTLQHMVSSLLRKKPAASLSKQLQAFADAHRSSLPDKLYERLAQAGSA